MEATGLMIQQKTTTYNSDYMVILTYLLVMRLAHLFGKISCKPNPLFK